MIPYMRGSGILDSTWCLMRSVGKQNLTTCLGLALFKGQNSSRLPRPQVRDTDCAVFSAGASEGLQFLSCEGRKFLVDLAMVLASSFTCIYSRAAMSTAVHSAATPYCTVITGRTDCTVRHVTYQLINTSICTTLQVIVRR